MLVLLSANFSRMEIDDRKREERKAMTGLKSTSLPTSPLPPPPISQGGQQPNSSSLRPTPTARVSIDTPARLTKKESTLRKLARRATLPASFSFLHHEKKQPGSPAYPLKDAIADFQKMIFGKREEGKKGEAGVLDALLKDDPKALRQTVKKLQNALVYFNLQHKANCENEYEQTVPAQLEEKILKKVKDITEEGTNLEKKNKIPAFLRGDKGISATDVEHLEKNIHELARLLEEHNLPEAQEDLLRTLTVHNITSSDLEKFRDATYAAMNIKGDTDTLKLACTKAGLEEDKVKTLKNAIHEYYLKVFSSARLPEANTLPVALGNAAGVSKYEERYAKAHAEAGFWEGIGEELKEGGVSVNDIDLVLSKLIDTFFREIKIEEIFRDIEKAVQSGNDPDDIGDEVPLKYEEHYRIARKIFDDGKSFDAWHRESWEDTSGFLSDKGLNQNQLNSVHERMPASKKEETEPAHIKNARGSLEEFKEYWIDAIVLARLKQNLRFREGSKPGGPRKVDMEDVKALRAWVRNFLDMAIKHQSRLESAEASSKTPLHRD